MPTGRRPVGVCKAGSVHGSTMTNMGTLTCFNGGTTPSRSNGNVAFNGSVHEEDWAGVNMLRLAA